jgi:hypothetical protein
MAVTYEGEHQLSTLCGFDNIIDQTDRDFVVYGLDEFRNAEFSADSLQCPACLLLTLIQEDGTNT